MATLGIGQAGDRARLRHRRIPQASQKPGVAYHDPIIEGAPGPRRRAQLRHAAEDRRGARGEEGHGARAPAGHAACSGPASPRSCVGTKAYYVRAGVFKDVDICIFAHVGDNLERQLGRRRRQRPGLGRVQLQGRERARRRRAVARPLGARRGRADGRRLELPPRAPAPPAALALRDHQRRRSAERRAAATPSVWYYFRETDYAHIKELWDIGDTHGEGARR